MAQPTDPYVDLARRLPSFQQADEFNKLEAEALKEGKYFAFLSRTDVTDPEFAQRLAAANERAVRERPTGPTLKGDRYVATKAIAKEAMRRTAFYAGKGDMTAAVQSCLDAMRMSKVAFDNGPLIDHLVGVAVYSIASNSLRSVSQVIPVDQAKQLQAACDAALDLHAYQGHLRAELAFVSARDTSTSVPDTGDEPDPDIEKLRAMTPAERQALHRRAAARLSDFFDKVAQVASTESKVTARDLERLTKAAAAKTGLEDTYVRHLASLIQQDFKAEIKKRTLARVVWLYAAVDIYRAQHGDLPATLDLAVPADRIIEPFSGLPFQYGRHDNAFWIELPDNDILGGKTGLKWVHTTNPSSEMVDGEIPPR